MKRIVVRWSLLWLSLVLGGCFGQQKVGMIDANSIADSRPGDVSLKDLVDQLSQPDLQPDHSSPADTQMPEDTQKPEDLVVVPDLLGGEETSTDSSIEPDSGLCVLPNQNCSKDSDCCEGSCFCGSCSKPADPLLTGDWAHWQIGNATDWLQVRRFKADGRFEESNSTFHYSAGFDGHGRLSGRYRSITISGELYAYSVGGIEVEQQTSEGTRELWQSPYLIFTPHKDVLGFTYDGLQPVPPERLTFKVYHNLPINSIRYARIARRYALNNTCDAADTPGTLLEETAITYYFETSPQTPTGGLCVLYSGRYRPAADKPLQEKSGQICGSFTTKALEDGSLILELKGWYKQIDSSDFWNGCASGVSVCDRLYEGVSVSRLYLPKQLDVIVPVWSPQYRRVPYGNEVSIPKSPFVMGSKTGVGDKDEQPQHTVSLDQYHIDKLEVTVADWKKCMKTGHCGAPSILNGMDLDDPERQNHPVQFVSWQQAMSFCLWAGKRLPTEAEWEKAGRGTDARIYPWGNTADTSLFNGDPMKMQPVGSYTAGKSPYGVLDLIGNAPEWVYDSYDATYYSISPDYDPRGPEVTPDNKNHVIRGYFNLTQQAPRLADRTSWNSVLVFSSIHPYGIGFRCAR